VPKGHESKGDEAISGSPSMSGNFTYTEPLVLPALSERPTGLSRREPVEPRASLFSLSPLGRRLG
jgi:hypothetical protein